MRPVYAVQFEVRSPDPGKAPSPAQIVKDCASRWVAHWYRERTEVAVAVPLEGGDIEPLNLHRVEVSSVESSTGDGLWSLTWSYPADPDDKLLWQSNVNLCEADGVTEVAIIIRIASREFRIAPMTFDVRRPYIVKMLLEALPCYLGGRQLQAFPRPVGVEDVAAFESFMFDRERRLPIVLMSRDPYTNQCRASPTRIADVLAGLAEVHVLNDKWTGFCLTRAVGSAFSCFNGAVRIYWPGLDKEGSSLPHKVLMPDEVGELGDQLADYLMRRFAPISALRITELASARKVRGNIEADRTREVTQLAEKLNAGTVAEGHFEAEFFKLIDERDVAIAARNTVEAERDAAQLRALELEEENQSLQENVKVLSAYQPRSEATPTALAPQQPDPGSVRAALDLAGKDFEQIVVWSSAECSADESAFARPLEVYEALMAVNELADTYFQGRKTGKNVGAWEDWFGQRGFRYAPTEHQNTLTMYGTERDFTQDGVKRRMLRHLTLGGGDRTNCLQIYFDIDDDAKRFLIGYCGPHLPYYGMRT